MVSLDHFSHELQARMQRATVSGEKFITVNAHDLHTSFGRFTSTKDPMIPCRLAMREAMNVGDVLLVAEDNSAGLTVRYILPRPIS